MGCYVHKLKTARITSVPERLAPPSQCGGTEVMPSSVAPLPALPSSVAPLPALPPRSVPSPGPKSPQSVRPLPLSNSMSGDVRPLVATSPLAPEITRPETGQSAVMGVPVRTDSNVNTGAEDAAQQQRRGGRHTKVHVAPGTEPQRTIDRPKRSRRSWFGLGQTEKEVAALQDRLGGMSETECRQVDSAARYLQERWRCVVKTPRLVAARASIYRSRRPTALLRATLWAWDVSPRRLEAKERLRWRAGAHPNVPDPPPLFFAPPVGAR